MKKRIASALLALVMALSLLPAAAFAAEEETPFTAMAGEEELTVIKSEEDYVYTVVTEYDANWNPVATEERTAPLYVVTVPADTGDVTLDFGGEERIAYTYDANGNYVGACGEYGDGTVGQTTAAVSDLTAYVRVQTPYDESWNSDFLYAVAFDTDREEGQPGAPAEIHMDTLMANIAAGYVESSSEWVVLDMAAYAATGGETVTSDAAKQAYIDAAIASVTAEGAGETAFAKAILVLQAIGADPEALYPEGASEPVSAVADLTAITGHSASAWVAPYTLAALNQEDYGTEELEQSILAAVLANQAEDGSWSEWGDNIQTTANMVAGLSFYYGEDETATAAVDKAVAFLSAAQKEDGSYDAYGSGADANTAAMVVVALSALGIDPDDDERFVKNGVSALEGLLSFALADESGFGYTNNTVLNAYATEQGFRALIAASRVMETGEAYNIYDFSTNQVSPAYAGGAPEKDDGDDGKPSKDTITVSFALEAHQETWIAPRSVKIGKDAAVADLFYKVLEQEEGFSFVDQGGYISSITYGDTTLAEFDEGPNSGWKYTVNGAAPVVGMGDKTLEDGDKVVWYYVTDYTEDTTPDESKPAIRPADGGDLPYTDTEGHWAEDAIRYCYEKDIISGVSAGSFAPEETLTRAMLVTILWRCAGEPEPSGQGAYADVAEETWYTDAVNWAAEQGIVSGYGDGRFGPCDAVTREQLALILMNYAKGAAEEGDLASFTDAEGISPWALEAMKWANGQGLITGRTETTIVPQGAVKRGEAAAILMRYLENN